MNRSKKNTIEELNQQIVRNWMDLIKESDEGFKRVDGEKREGKVGQFGYVAIRKLISFSNM